MSPKIIFFTLIAFALEWADIGFGLCIRLSKPAIPWSYLILDIVWFIIFSCMTVFLFLYIFKELNKLERILNGWTVKSYEYEA